MKKDYLQWRCVVFMSIMKKGWIRKALIMSSMKKGWIRNEAFTSSMKKGRLRKAVITSSMKKGWLWEIVLSWTVCVCKPRNDIKFERMPVPGRSKRTIRLCPLDRCYWDHQVSEKKLLKIIDSQVNGQDWRKAEAVMRIVPEEEEEENYLPSWEAVLKI